MIDQGEPFEDFDKLLLGIRVSHPVPAPNSTALEQTDIAREHHSLLAGSCVRDFKVLLKHERVEASESQERGELAEMHVDGEPDRTAHISPDTTYPADVDAPERRIHRHVVTLQQPMGELLGSSVDQDQVDLWMRYAERLDRVLYRGTRCEGVCEPSSAVPDTQEIVQLCVESKRHLDRVHAFSALVAISFVRVLRELA